MKWILLYVLVRGTAGLTSGTMEFETEELCKKAIVRIAKQEVLNHEVSGIICLQNKQ